MRCDACDHDADSGTSCCGKSLCFPCWSAHRCGPERPLWPHQERVFGLVEDSFRRGHRAVAVTLPTGMGKTEVMTRLCRRAAAKGKRAALFTNRRVLTWQAARNMERAGVDYGVLAAGYAPAAQRPVQVLSAQTVDARVFKKGRYDLPEADLVLVDEAHGGAFGKAVTAYLERGALVLGFTATPVGMAGLYTDLVVAGTKAEGRACGALVPCDVFAPSEPDLKGVKWEGVDVLNEKARQRVMQCVVFADVFREWELRNPFRRPTLLWAPGVKESRWFVEQFRARGVTAEHVGNDTPQAERERIFAGSESGEVQVVSSMGVLTEGADLPWVYCGLLARPCGSLRLNVQIVGRILRAHPGKDHAVLLDFAGSWHRHGSPNADRQWHLEDTDRSVRKERKRALREGKEEEGIRCPDCGGVRSSGPKCPHCGREHVRSVRAVRFADGTLKKMVGSVVKKAAKAATGDAAVWTACLFAAAATGRTVRQAAADFRRRAGHDPREGCRPQPAGGSGDWDRAAGDVYPFLTRKRKRGA